MEPSVPTNSAGRFMSPESWLDPLDPATAAELISASADIALVLDRAGVIRDLSVSAADFPADLSSTWIGRSWDDLVAPDSRDKVHSLVEEANARRISKWREINHRADGPDIPIRFIAMKLGPAGTIALGRDLRVVGRLQQRMVELQRSVDRQYQRLRNAETRYRLLFQLSGEAVLIVDAGNRKVGEANAAAASMLGMPVNKVIGKPIEDLFVAAAADDIEKAATAARTVGRADPIRIEPATEAAPVVATFSAFRQDSGTHLLVRLASEQADAVRPQGMAGKFQEIVRGLPEAFVVIDLDRRVLDCNESFLEITELTTVEQARGQRVDRWLGRPGVDVELVVSNLKEHGSIRDFATILRGEYDGQEEVELTAVAVPGGPVPCYGLLIRPLHHRAPSAIPRESDFSRSVEQLAALVGRVSLKDLVRETTDLVEQMCIQAALNLTGDNRASAAQILGLSRQGLYAKLRRYGMGDLDGETNATDAAAD